MYPTYHISLSKFVLKTMYAIEKSEKRLSCENRISCQNFINKAITTFGESDYLYKLLFELNPAFYHYIDNPPNYIKKVAIIVNYEFILFMGNLSLELMYHAVKYHTESLAFIQIINKKIKRSVELVTVQNAKLHSTEMRSVNGFYVPVESVKDILAIIPKQNIEFSTYFTKKIFYREFCKKKFKFSMPRIYHLLKNFVIKMN